MVTRPAHSAVAALLLMATPRHPRMPEALASAGFAAVSMTAGIAVAMRSRRAAFGGLPRVVLCAEVMELTGRVRVEGTIEAGAAGLLTAPRRGLRCVWHGRDECSGAPASRECFAVRDLSGVLTIDPRGLRLVSPTRVAPPEAGVDRLALLRPGERITVTGEVRRGLDGPPWLGGDDLEVTVLPVRGLARARSSRPKAPVTLRLNLIVCMVAGFCGLIAFGLSLHP